MIPFDVAIDRFLARLVLLSTVIGAIGHVSPAYAAAPAEAAEMKDVPAKLNPPPKPVFDPRHFGAKGDGVTYDTAALQKAINACAGSGGSVRLAGGKFLTAQLTLKSKMTLYIEKGAVLLGGTHPEDYPELTPGNDNLGTGHKNGIAGAICRSMLYADGVENLSLDGGGTIDGQGPRVQMSGKENTRPSILRFFYGTHISMRNLTLANPRMWTQVYIECNDLTIDHETVHAPAGYTANLDGCDICDCSSVVMTNCRINAEDDGICLKSGSKTGLHNVTIENNWITDYHANAIKLGTSSAGPVSGLHILNNTVLSAKFGGLCLESVDGSAISDVTVKGLDLYNVSQPIYIRLAHRSHEIGSIKGVTIENVRAISAATWTTPSCTITGIPGAQVQNVTLKNCYFEMPGGVGKKPGKPTEQPTEYPQSNQFGDTPAYAFYVRHAQGIVFDHVETGFYHEDVRPWIAMDDANVKTIECKDLKQIEPTKPPAR